MVLVLRSLLFNVLFYLNTVVFLIIGLPTFLMPYQAIVEVAKTWGRANLFLLRVVAGVRFELRGAERIPPGALIVASKHQSAWETFALMHLFRSPTFVMNMALNPQGMVEKHPVTRKLLAEFFTPMPNQNITPEQARQVVEYLRTEGDHHGN